MSQAAIRELLELLTDMLSPDDLRRWIPNLPDGDRIAAALPGGTVAPANYFFAAVDTFRRYGLLGVPEFWDALAAAAPTLRQPAVHQLRAKFGVAAAAAGVSFAQQSAAPQSAAPQPATRPAQIVVLLVSANPQDTVRLRVDAEFREIIQKVASTPARDRIRFEQVPATRFEDLRSALLRYQPHVLHFSGHGEPDGGLRFEAKDKDSHVISKRRVIGLLSELNDNLRLVVVNACYSKAVICDVPPAVDLAIGMNDAVADEALIEFSASFYETLGYGKTVERAFKVALASLEDEDAACPELFPAAPDPKRQLVLVQP